MAGYERSFHRRMHREAVALVLASARAQGCTCDPNITIPDDAGPGKVRVATVAHDWDCPRCQPEHESAKWHQLRDEINAGGFDAGAAKD